MPRTVGGNHECIRICFIRKSIRQEKFTFPTCKNTKIAPGEKQELDNPSKIPARKGLKIVQRGKIWLFRMIYHHLDLFFNQLLTCSKTVNMVPQHLTCNMGHVKNNRPYNGYMNFIGKSVKIKLYLLENLRNTNENWLKQ